jgi:hypothetical protein
MIIAMKSSWVISHIKITCGDLNQLATMKAENLENTIIYSLAALIQYVHLL